ncbi:hypothetical protein KBY66_15080 [Synechococcus sp. Tobar12-5m-g]|uniref:ABC transporter six-transmembrane domain-containing protein n=1 Tax=unclassified Synechococcus TaxID=2626047 RepID=UPI0020CD599D|nr:MULTISPECIES: ABC transporter six-transmembrane domain-containing protein [unclassified Synechococcus]MCP9773914.1 hypothetical protein [Synechococcus sp. Tobar12-5m-g]MCP9874909.1 hypothetical protein [Synechococcus sp. Cruz CV-v-12]
MSPLLDSGSIQDIQHFLPEAHYLPFAPSHDHRRGGLMTQTILSELSRGERLAIAGTYTLTLLENLCMLAYPALTGLAVDGLLERSYQGLSALIAVWLVHLVVSFVRQRYDTRVFMGLYARLAVQTVADQNSRGHGTSIVSARVEMMRDMVGFFEADVPAMFSQVVTVIGSLVMLFTFDLEAGFIAMAVLLPMALVNAWYWRRARQLHRGLNDQIEREVEDIEAARLLRLRRHFGRVRRWHVQLSDSESWTWSVTELATIVALVVILIDFTRSPGFSAGAIYAVLAYVFDYLEGLDHAPTLVNNVSRFQDIRTRLGR